MTKVRQLKIAVISLILINLATFSFFFFMAPPPPKQAPKQIIIEKLNLDAQQIEDYEFLIARHQTAIKPAEERICAARNELYVLLKAETSPVEIENATQQITTIQYEIETIHFNHFLALKNSCKTNQLENFYDLTSELESLFRPNKMKP